MTGGALLSAVLSRPWISVSVKRNIATAVATELRLSPLVRDFFALVTAHGRVSQLSAIAAAYRDLVDEDRGIVRGRVRTAVRLNEGEQTELSRRLGAVKEGREVILEQVVDEGVLGGVIAEIGDLVLDGSLRGQLARVRERLARGSE